MENYEKMFEILERMRADVEAFYEKGNKSAGTRVRTACQEIKKVAQDLRVHVQETKNANS
jgi:hypothetical protein